MRKLVALLGLLALVGVVAIPAAAEPGAKRDRADRGKADRQGHTGRCGKDRRGEPGYEVIFDGSRKCFRRWRYAGGASVTLQRDGTLRAGPGAPDLGVLWYAARPYGDFSLRLQFRDDAPEEGARANSGVQVRFPAPRPPVPGCNAAWPGNPPSPNGAGWIAVNCGHEIQINDNTGGDPVKTGSIYGFANLNIEQARPVPKGTWSDLEIRVVGQHYTVIRDGEVINEFENAPDLPFPGRPNDGGSNARGLVGYIGLQAHGAPNDVASFRDIRILDLSNQD
jgi:hypothetical protein